MPINPAYRSETLSILNLVAPIADRAMFGGVGLYCHGVFFALMANDKLYFKVDDSNRADYLEAGAEPWSQGDGYYEVPPFVLDNPDELEVWLDKAVRVAEAKKARAPASRRPGRAE